MYYIYWIEPDETVATEAVDTHTNIYDWARRYLVEIPEGYAYDPTINKWAIYKINESDPRMNKAWMLIPAHRVLPAIKTFHLLTH